MKPSLAHLVLAAALASSGCSLLSSGNAGIINGVPVVGQAGIQGARPVGYVYTTLYGKNAVLDINTIQSTASSEPIPTPNGPRALAIDPRGIEQYLYVVCQLANVVAIVDRRSRTTIRSINVGTQPYAIAVTPEGTRAFVTNYGDDTVSVLDLTTNNVIGTIQLNPASTTQPTTTGGANATPVRMQPRGIASNAAGTRIYVACAGGYMVELDGQPPTTNPATGVVTSQGNQYSAVRNVQLTGSVAPLNVAVASDGTTDSVYITDPQGNKVFYVPGSASTAATTGTGTATTPGAAQAVQGSGGPWGAAVGYTAAGKPEKLYVTQSSGAAVSVYDLPNLTASQAANVEGHNPQGVAVSSDSTDVYVSVTGDNSVAVLHRTTNGTLSRPEYFNLSTLSQNFATSTGELALGGYI